jgi:hypothetical protein
MPSRGRKKAALTYVLTYTLGCFTKHWGVFTVLLVGRLFCGVATSLLYSAFESWLVAEHFKVIAPSFKNFFAAPCESPVGVVIDGVLVHHTRPALRAALSALSKRALKHGELVTWIGAELVCSSLCWPCYVFIIANKYTIPVRRLGECYVFTCSNTRTFLQQKKSH